MPQPGEIRRGATESVQWDGSRWNVIPNEAPAQGGFFHDLGALTAHPLDTLSDLLHGAVSHPAATAEGFAQGAATGLPTAAKIVQTAAPFVTDGASIPLQMAVGAGTQGLADVADKAAGDPGAPATFTDLLERMAGGAAIPGILGALGKGVSAIKNAVPSGATVDKALAVGSHIPGLKTVSRIGQTVRSFADDTEPEVAQAVGRLVKKGSPTATPPLESTLDDVLKGLSDEPAPLGDTPTVRSVDRGNLAAPPDTSAHDAAEKFNIRQNAPYGEGAIMPSAVQPSEFRATALDGLNAPDTGQGFDATYHQLTGKTNLPFMDVVDAGETSQTTPSATDVDQLVNQIPASLRSAANDETPSPATVGEWFDRGSVDTGAQAAPMKGEEGYVYDPESANLRADPQTAIDDLLQAREDALQGGDPMKAREFSRDISQRNKAGFNIATGQRLPFKKGISVLKVKMPAVAAIAPDIPF